MRDKQPDSEEFGKGAAICLSLGFCGGGGPGSGKGEMDVGVISEILDGLLGGGGGGDGKGEKNW